MSFTRINNCFFKQIIVCLGILFATCFISILEANTNKGKIDLDKTSALYSVKMNNGWGYVDVKNNIIIAAYFDEAEDFSDGLGQIKIDDKWGYVNSNSQIVIPPKYEKSKPFFNGLASVKVNGKWGYIDKNGRIKIDFKYINADSFEEGLAAVSETGKDDSFGFINTDGKYVISPGEIDFARSFREGLAAVKDKNKWGYINTKGEMVITYKFDDALNFSNQLAAVKIGKNWGYIDKKGKEIIPPLYEYAGMFTDNGALVYVNGKSSIINQEGKIINFALAPVAPKPEEMNQNPEKEQVQDLNQSVNSELPRLSVNYNWCRLLNDRRKINFLSIPGTHDSGSFKFNNMWAKCQGYCIEDQLRCGVRYLDMRVGMDNGVVKMWHGSAGQGNITLEQALMQVHNYLVENDNRKEFVILHFKNDDSISDSKIVPEVEKVLYKGAFKNIIYDKNKIPEAGEVRGKMLYWHRWDSSKGLKVGGFGGSNNYGPIYLSDGSGLYVSDLWDYSISNKKYNLDIWLDWTKKLYLDWKRWGSHYLVLTFCSTSTGSDGCGWLPWRSADKINPFIKSYLARQSLKYFGIVIVDWVDPSLAQSIWSLNFKSDDSAYGKIDP